MNCYLSSILLYNNSGDRSSLLHSGVSDDDGARNTYDDNDSFLDDAIMGSDQEEGEAEGEGKKEKGSKSDDSDWNPDDGEVKGAKKAKVHWTLKKWTYVVFWLDFNCLVNKKDL